MEQKVSSPMIKKWTLVSWLVLALARDTLAARIAENSAVSQLTADWPVTGAEERTEDFLGMREGEGTAGMGDMSILARRRSGINNLRWNITGKKLRCYLSKFLVEHRNPPALPQSLNKLKIRGDRFFLYVCFITSGQVRLGYIGWAGIFPKGRPIFFSIRRGRGFSVRQSLWGKTLKFVDLLWKPILQNICAYVWDFYAYNIYISFFMIL